MSLRAVLTRLISALITLIVWTASAGACLVKDPSGTLNVRNAPNGLVKGGGR
jgi:hypothetical protein